jgi:hypothetical protein
MRHSPIPRLLVLAFLALLASSLSAGAQVLVYKLSFEKTGKTLNYDFYDGGYFVCTGPRGEGTFILTVRANGQRYYTTAAGGTLFYINDGGERLAVLTANGGDGGASATYQATGNIDGSKSIGGGFAMRYARDLDGYLLASQESGDAVVSDGSDRTEGFAGYSRIKVRIDNDKTRQYNDDVLTQEEAVTELEEYLDNHGYLTEPTSTTPTTTE